MSICSLKTVSSAVVVATLAYFSGLFGEAPVPELTVAEKMSIASKIANNVLKLAPSGPDVKFGELWKDHRLAAREISAIKPTLDQNNVKLIGVGLEELGVQEFIDGKFFDGELYIDSKKQSYNDLGFERFGFLGLFPAILSSLSRAAQGRAKALGLGGNMAGDGYQNGGAIVVEKGGEQTLLHYKQKEAADHVSNSEVLKALGISFDPNNVPTAETGPQAA